MSLIQQNNIILFKKPIEVCRSIPLNPSAPQNLGNSFQERIFLLQWQQFGKTPTYQLEKANKDDNAHPLNNAFQLTDPYGNVVTKDHLLPIYPFVILDRHNFMELRIGKGNHYFIAERKSSVLAAGDLYVGWDDNNSCIQIEEITDQSGGYHTECTETLNSAKTAIAATHLPIDKFVHFTEKQKINSLFFSNPMNIINTNQSNNSTNQSNIQNNHQMSRESSLSCIS